jgi:hypothetical protein
VYESQWDAGKAAWAVGVELRVTELASTDATHRRRPTGASADDLTLFFFDEVAGVQRAAWRDTPSAMFSQFADIAVAPEAAPNLDCADLYFQGTGGVFVAQ